MLIDLEKTPWSLPSNHFESVLLKHVLEHLGANFGVFRSVIQELYRVCAPGARLDIHVPHHKHDNFWSDPTHVRAFTPLTFKSMSQKVCADWVARNVGNTMLAYLLDVDFEVESMVQHYDPVWWQRVERGELTKEALAHAAQIHWGVVRELHVCLRVVKPSNR
jgi:SAM-dependent methyltransferase